MAREWTHLISFIAKEDDQVHLGQVVDERRDVGLDNLNDVPIKAYLISGSIFNGTVTDQILTVKQLLPPVSQNECSYIRCIGLNYSDHADEANMNLPKAPVVFIKPRTSLTGPYPGKINVARCAQDKTIDYEAELCVVMGKTGHDIKEEDALGYVLGYTASNDVSPRNLQFETAQWSFGKGLDNCCPIGPVLISAKALPDPQTVEFKAVYNGEVVQHSHTSKMIFSVAKLIAFLSRGTTLEAGSLILTGTCSGIGYFREPRVYLEDGSDIRVYFGGGIGTLINKVRYEDI